VVVVVASLFFYGVKGGVFTLLGGGDYLVWGPPDSFIWGNNELAFALVVVLPLAWYLFTAYGPKYRWVRFGVPAAAGLSLISILGSYSRGAFLAVGAMLFFLWLRGRRRLLIAGLATLAGLTALVFMPSEWVERMESIRTYTQDPSALGRLNSWMFAIELANAHPVTGGGSRAFTPELFQQYAPDPENFHDAHSIFFEVLAEQGYVGLLLYLILGITALVTASRTVTIAKRHDELAWAGDLARFSQVSLIGYAVGGAFLGLAYFDLPYAVMAFIACTYGLVRREDARLRTPQDAVNGDASTLNGDASDPAVYHEVGKEAAIDR
jgi:probable O-glycosylation ligase (exosortase A-associated)